MEQMEAVLGRLSEIEGAAVALEEKAAEQKKQIAAEFEAKTKAFDEEIDAQTQEKLKTLNEKLKLSAENELLKMKQTTERQLAVEVYRTDNRDNLLLRGAVVIQRLSYVDIDSHFIDQSLRVLVHLLPVDT